MSWNFNNKKHRQSISHQTEYTHYLKHNMSKKHRLEDREQFLIFIREYFKTIKENVIESQGGVYLDRVGYFYNFMIPYKMTTDFKKNELFYFNTDLYRYFPTAIFVNKLHFWTMDMSYAPDTKKGIVEQLKKGKIYHNYVSSLRRLGKL